MKRSKFSENKQYLVLIKGCLLLMGAPQLLKMRESHEIKIEETQFSHICLILLCTYQYVYLYWIHTEPAFLLSSGECHHFAELGRGYRGKQL